MADYVEIEDAEVAPESPITTSLMTRLRDNALAFLGAPTGTSILLRQASAPIGWTRVTTGINDKALRVVTGSLSDGGTLAFSTVFSKQATDDHTLTTSQMPSHPHTASSGSMVNHVHETPAPTTKAGEAQPYSSGTPVDQLWRGNTTTTTAGQNVTTGPSITVNSAGGGDPHDHGMDIRVQHVDLGLYTRDATP